jgi:hypothetical protein
MIMLLWCKEPRFLSEATKKSEFLVQASIYNSCLRID